MPVPVLERFILGMGGMEKEQCVFIVQMFKIWLMVLHGNLGQKQGENSVLQSLSDNLIISSVLLPWLLTCQTSC